MDDGRRQLARPAGRTSAWDTLEDAIASGNIAMISTDVFDTVMFRDGVPERARLAEAAAVAAPQLGVDPRALARLRWSAHASAYSAVALEGGDGDASLARISQVMASALGLDADAARVIQRSEVDVDITHLRPHRRLLGLLQRAAGAGRRVIAVSDTYYSTADLRRMLGSVVGAHPFHSVYASADVGRTKHAGGLFDVVTAREGIPAEGTLHVGDNVTADVVRARAAGWRAVHLPRHGSHDVTRTVKAAASLLTTTRRLR